MLVLVKLRVSSTQQEYQGSATMSSNNAFSKILKVSTDSGPRVARQDGLESLHGTDLGDSLRCSNVLRHLWSLLLWWQHKTGQSQPLARSLPR